MATQSRPGERIGRYSFLGTAPFLSLTASGTQVRRRSASEDVTFEADDPLGELERLVGQFRAPHLPGLPRFCGGAVGYAGYDTVRYVERLPNPPADDRRLPDLAFSLYDRMVIFDHLRKTILVVAPPDVRSRDASTKPSVLAITAPTTPGTPSTTWSINACNDVSVTELTIFTSARAAPA